MEKLKKNNNKKKAPVRVPEVFEWGFKVKKTRTRPRKDVEKRLQNNVAFRWLPRFAGPALRAAAYNPMSWGSVCGLRGRLARR